MAILLRKYVMDACRNFIGPVKTVCLKVDFNSTPCRSKHNRLLGML